MMINEGWGVMTNKEAIDILKNTAWLGTDNEIKVYPAVKMAIEALEKADKYRWHDLRKNPEDLPKHNNKVLVYYRKRNSEKKMQYGLDRIIGDYPAGWKGFQRKEH